MNYHKYFIIILGILACFSGNINAQEPTPDLYSISVKQSFSSWGNCSSDPDFDYADISLYFGNNLFTKHITTTNLSQIQEFNGVFKNINQSKELKFLKYGNDTLTKIEVHTNANDIKNDHDLYYNLETNELVVGVYSESHEASDPCNNIISSNREGYTMTTTVYIDDPIYIANTGSSSLNLDFEKVGLRIGGYYENGHTNKPFLQVALDSDPENWIDLKQITIKPNSTLYLGYEDIVGKKNVSNTRFFEWMGKSLRFRVIKTLKNNELTTGNIVTSIKFYPDGLQYTIEDITRTNCDENVRVYVELVNDTDRGYINLNTDQYYWVAFDGVTAFNCEMVPRGGLKFEIILDPGDLSGDPFDEPNTEDMVWTLQMQEKDNPGFIACERTFTIPEKPGEILINQKPKSFPVNGTLYNLPSMSNPYALLNIEDNYSKSALRRPYTITGPNGFKVEINEVPTAYEDLSDVQKAALDQEFNDYFSLMTESFYNEENTYSSYFSYRYKEWFNNQNATSPSYRITHPNGAIQFFASNFHIHTHSHSCTHSHVHTHSCFCIPNNKKSDTLKIDDTRKLPNCPTDYTMECYFDDHSIPNPDPHTLCNHTSHIIEEGDWSQTHDDTHTHTEYHSHIHSHIGIHAHGENSNYDYTLIKKFNLSNDELSDFSTTYNNVSYISLTTTGFNADYIFRRNGVDINIPIWNENEILHTIYPNIGIAQTWYDDYKAIYKEQWLEEKLGVKVPIPVTMVNQLPIGSVQELILYDYHGCDYPFSIDVDAPPVASFTLSSINPPSEACAENGGVTITYNGGGVPPYKHAAGDLNEPGDQIVITTGLIYGPNAVRFTDAMGNESETIIVTLDGSVGITSSSVLHQTCTPANGKITVNVGSVSGTKTYTLTNEYTNEKYVQTLNANSCIFPNLPAGIYNAKVENSTCPSFNKYGIEVESHIFQVSDTPTDATTIGSNGSVAISFENRINNVTWTYAPATFTVANTNNVNYQVAPGDYNITATHIDQYGNGCNVPVDFEIKAPTFSATVNIEETENNATVSVSLTGSDLIDNYQFRLLNSSGSEVNPPVVQTDGEYTVNMIYDGKNIDVYTFDFPSATIINGKTVVEPTCPGGNGTVTLTPSGGLDGTNLTISTDGVTYTSTKAYTVQAGDFTYKIKDENTRSENNITINHALINSFTVPITEPNPVNANIIPIDVTCAGKGDGRVSIANMSEGSGTYQYRVDNTSWKSPQTETTGLMPGNHVVYLRDSYNNCPAVTLTNFTISQPDSLKIDSVRIVQPTCELENGEIFVEAMGGNGLFQFDWTFNSNSFHSTTLSEDPITHLEDSLQYGNYNLTVIDNNNCSFTKNIELNEYFNPLITNTRFTDARCYGDSNGEIVVHEVTGTNPLNKITLNGLDFELKDTIDNIANPFGNLPKGRYELIAIDDSSCASDATYQITVGQPDTILYAIIDTIVPVLQKGKATGQIHTTIYGGNSGFKTLSLLNSDNLVLEQKQERNQFSTYFDSLYTGNYSLEIIDEKGCKYNSPELTVIEPLTTLGFNVTYKKDALCKSQTGSFAVEGFGGFGQYQFKRASDNGYYDFNTFNNLYAGNYIVTVRDRLGATFTDTIVIYEPKDSLQASLIDYSNPTCGNNGSLSINFNGGVAPYKVFFDNSSDTSEIPTPQNYTITNRPFGGYLLHIEDDNGCKFELETNLSEQELIQILDFDLTYPSSSSASDGEIVANIKGGKSPLSYSWKEQFGSTLPETSRVLSNIPSGHYELTVHEDNGCAATKSTYLADITDQSLEIIEIQHETSYQAENGYAHLYSDLGSLVNIEIIDPDGTQSIYPITDSTSMFYEENSNIYLRNLKGGSYFVMAISSLNEKIYIEFEIKTYEPFDFENIEITHAKEINDSSGIIYVVVEGGAGENSFDWESLDETVNHLDSINSEYTSILQNIIAGNYSVTVTDKFNNSISRSFLVEQPDTPLDISITDYRNESCKDYEDAYVILQAKGGWGDYQFKQDSVKYFTNDSIWLNLSVREHYFYLTDKMGTVDSIAINITEPDYLKANVEFIDSVNCKDASDGNIFLNVSGGTEPYRFANINSPLFWTQDTIVNNLSEGSYSFIFTDDHNCIGQDTVHTYIPEPDSLLFNSINVIHSTCNTDNGAISVVMQGGTKPYQYEWTNFEGNVIGNQNAVSELNRNALYFLQVQDAHNCLQQYQQLIKPSTNPVVVDIKTVPVLCYGGSTGKANIVEVTPANPYAPYSFKWSNTNTGEYSEGYAAGLHSVMITDTNNCSTIKYFEVTQPDTLQLEVIDFKDAHCYGYNDAFIEIQNSGGVGNYDIHWLHGETTGRIDSLVKGVYSVTITDSNLCSIERSFEIMEPDQVIVELGDDIKICPGNTINIDGQEFTTHQWSNSNGVISDERFLSVGTEDTYYLEVTNSIGCFAYDDISVKIGNNALQADFLMSSEANLGDTLFIYEISNLELDSLYWDYNPDAFKDITEDFVPNYILQLESNKVGIFNIDLWAYSGGCISSIVKQVEITEINDSIDDDDFLGYTNPLILELNVYPNPTDGNFTLSVELREIADINVDLFSISYGIVLDKQERTGQDYYDIEYRMNALNTGVYVIMVTAKNERKQLKIIVE